MPFRLTRPHPFKSLMLRPKLIAAFVAMAIVTTFCGGVGVFFVDRIGKSVAVFSDVTSPLLTESMALVENARSMRSVLYRGIVNGDDIDQVPQRLAGLDAESRGHLQTLRRLSAEAGIGIRIDAAERYERDFVATLDAMLAAYHRAPASAPGSMKPGGTILIRCCTRWTLARKANSARRPRMRPRSGRRPAPSPHSSSATCCRTS
jgi:hypothetical protein